MRLFPYNFKDAVLNPLRLKGPSCEVKVLNSIQVESTPVHTCTEGWSAEWGAQGRRWCVQPTPVPVQIQDVFLLPTYCCFSLSLVFYGRI